MKEQARYSMAIARLHEPGDSTVAAEIQERPRAEGLSRPPNFAAHGPGPESVHERAIAVPVMRVRLFRSAVCVGFPFRFG